MTLQCLSDCTQSYLRDFTQLHLENGVGEVGVIGGLDRIALVAPPPLRDRRRVPDSSQCKNNFFAEVSRGSKKGSYLRIIDVCITQL